MPMRRRVGLRPHPLLAVACVLVVATACTSAADRSAIPTSSELVAPPPEPLGSFPAEVAADLRTEPDIVYTDVTDCGGTPCLVPGDLLAPAEGTGHPTIVLLHGGGMAFDRRRYQQDLAVALVERGAVVFLVSYRSAATGNGEADALDDARCAVRYARATTAEHGGDPDRVVVAGHSMGGLLALQLALLPDEEVDHCLAGGPSKPDAVVGLGAPRPSLFDAEPSAPPIYLLSGSEDSIARGTAGFLQDRGYDVEAAVLDGVTHDGITRPSEAPEIVDLIGEAIDATGG